MLPGQGWVLVLEPFSLCKYSDLPLPPSLWEEAQGPPYTKGWSRGLDDEAPPFPTDRGWGGGVGKPVQLDERGKESN